MAVDAVVTNLKGMARMISTSEEIAQVYLQRSIFLLCLFCSSCPSLQCFKFPFFVAVIGGYNISKWGKGNW